MLGVGEVASVLGPVELETFSLYAAALAYRTSAMYNSSTEQLHCSQVPMLVLSLDLIVVYRRVCVSVRVNSVLL
jgi:hypothetical protein